MWASSRTFSAPPMVGPTMCSCKVPNVKLWSPGGYRYTFDFARGRVEVGVVLGFVVVCLLFGTFGYSVSSYYFVACEIGSSVF